MNDFKWQKILKIQVFVYFVLALLNFYLLKVTEKDVEVSSRTMILVSFSIIVLGLLSIFEVFFSNSQIINKIGHIISVLFLPLIFLIITNGVLYRIQVLNHQFSIVLEFFSLLLPIVILIPIAFVEYGAIASNFFRLVAMIVLELSLLFSSIGFTSHNIVLNNIVQSGIIIPIVYFPFIWVIVKRWNFKFNLNIKIKKNSNSQLLWSLMLLFFMLWFPFFYVFLGVGDSWADIIWHWNFSFIDPRNAVAFNSISVLILSALEAAIFEELTRYISLLITLKAFKHYQAQLIYSILISAVLFALMHYTNLLDVNSSLHQVNEQAICTLGIGIFYAVLYLYTGQIWLSMIMHFMMNFLFFSLTPLGGAMGLIAGQANGEEVITFIRFLLPILMSVPFFFGKRRKLMTENANRIIAEEQII